MRIGILGAGMIGGTVARLFAAAGHDVAISNSRGPESLQELVKQIGPHVHAETIEGAARFGDVVLLAVPWREPGALPDPSVLSGKIVIDAMNPYKPDGGTYDLGNSTSSEEVQKRLPGARIVKAFNTMHYRALGSEGKPGQWVDKRLALFVAGDDDEAKAIVSKLISDIGFAPIDTGGLHEGGRRQEPDSPIYNRPMSAPEARRALAQTG
jgi:8-hydroxy-5-deazaflavin:NADPH oxidoreductase